jgi:hypothetical protein
VLHIRKTSVRPLFSVPSPIKIQGSLLARNTLLNFIGQAVPLIVGVVYANKQSLSLFLYKRGGNKIMQTQKHSFFKNLSVIKNMGSVPNLFLLKNSQEVVSESH